MKTLFALANLQFIFHLSLPLNLLAAPPKANLEKQNAELFEKVQKIHALNTEQTNKLKEIFSHSSVMSQGNPNITEHPISSEQCIANLKSKSVNYDNPEHEKICGSKYMAPLYKSEKEKAQDAKVCIDKFEFPNIPCEYPVVWVRADEAVRICQAVGKQLCDAHEWESACAGNLEDPDYDFSLIKKMSAENAVRTMRQNRNRAVESSKSWAYGKTFKKGICGQNSKKSANCNGGNWKECGSNTYPSGSFPDCKSSLDVYDQHGNAAEHMNLPLSKEQMASSNKQEYGHTEMKGSWFIWDKYQAHPDHCRWRAPYWHGSKVLDPKSHHNYHLGFRCCKKI
ncbi:MAG: SUMF1/EgtB/PvdO family nonheme iron enzyme [Oligoflexales bacterium]|nr:SUMF1/EgtB/PvdO family nonheme iron enzyme [Oligoflexales bacterium]